jgi:hypothetical protein
MRRELDEAMNEEIGNQHKVGETCPKAFITGEARKIVQGTRTGAGDIGVRHKEDVVF